MSTVDDTFERLKYDRVVDENGTIYFFNSAGELHKDGGPAVIYPDGEKVWYKEGFLHNDNGPAVVRADGSKQWFSNGSFCYEL